MLVAGRVVLLLLGVGIGVVPVAVRLLGALGVLLALAGVLFFPF
jgi:hypothetical protein